MRPAWHDGDVIWLWALLTVAIIGAVAVVASGRWGSMQDVHEDRPDVVVPATWISSRHIKDVRFSPSIRGYRQDEVDSFLDLLATEIDRRDDILERARIRLGDNWTVAGLPDDDDNKDPAPANEGSAGDGADGAKPVPANDGSAPARDVDDGYPWTGPASANRPADHTES